MVSIKPEPRQPRGQPDTCPGIVALIQPRQRRSQVVVLDIQARRKPTLRSRVPELLRPLGKTETPGSMSIPDDHVLAAHRKLLQPIVTDCLQHRVSGVLIT